MRGKTTLSLALRLELAALVQSGHVSRLNEAFAADTAHNTDLSEPGEFVDPDAIAGVVAAYDTLAATLPQPLKDSAHAVVVEQWRRLRRSDSVGRRPQS